MLPASSPMPAWSRPRRRSHAARCCGSSLRSKTFIVGTIVDRLLGLLGDHRLGLHARTIRSSRRRDILKAPNSTYWFGTDQFGRDIFSRVLAGRAVDAEGRAAATVIAITLGTILGLIMGFIGGFADDAISRLVDAILALPLIVIAVVVLTALGSSNITLILVIGLIFTLADRANGSRHRARRAAARLRAGGPAARRAGPVHHVRRDPARTSWARSSSRRPYGSGTRSSPSPG